VSVYPTVPAAIIFAAVVVVLPVLNVALAMRYKLVSQKVSYSQFHSNYIYGVA
tara:strand:- start:393 stop:551 length:159 start_codon:yes stop_codon:yes gene_type:complete